MVNSKETSVFEQTMAAVRQGQEPEVAAKGL